MNSRAGIPFGKRLLFVALALTACAHEAPANWDLERLQKPPQTFPAPAGIEVPDGVQAVCFAGLPWQGKPTRVFAYFGVPPGATPEHPAPGIVLVHGAGGTAFASWVRLWLDRGYAAIAFDHDGGIPIGKHDAWARHPQGGPKRGNIDQLSWPVEDQWMHHVVADTILAHSLLAAQPGVDANRIGATGVSWGAVALANAASVDPRLKFAALVYGCGFISGESGDGSSFVGQNGTPEQRAAWKAQWDPANFLSAARLPILWLNGTNDFAFTMASWQESYQTSPGPRTLALRVRMPHGHNGPGESPGEIPAFANSLLKDGEPMPQITGQGRTDRTVWVSYQSARPLKHAEFNITQERGRWQDRQWTTIPATIESGRVTATLPPKTTAYYFNVIDDRGLISSSEHRENKP